MTAIDNEPCREPLNEWERTTDGQMYMSANDYPVVFLHARPNCSGLKAARVIPAVVAEELWRLGQTADERWVGWCQMCSCVRKGEKVA